MSNRKRGSKVNKLRVGTMHRGVSVLDRTVRIVLQGELWLREGEEEERNRKRTRSQDPGDEQLAGSLWGLRRKPTPCCSLL